MIRTGLHSGFSFCQFFRRASVFSAAVALALMLQPRIGHANDTSDFVVNVLAGAGQMAGVPIGELEKKLVKQIVGEVADGKDISVAFKNAVMNPLLEGLPPEVQSAARCIANRTPVAECAMQQFSQAPEVVKCVAGGTPLATCAQREAVTRLPQEVLSAAECVASREKVAECAKEQARETIRKLENEARDIADKTFKAAPSAIQNILNIVDGVQKDDWEKVLQNGGAAFAKEIIRQVLSKFLTPAVMTLAGPIINTSVENRMGLIGDLIRAAKNGDMAAAAQIAFEGFLVFQIEMQCSLPLIPEEVRAAVCGPLGDIIRVLGGAVGSVTGDVLAVIAGAIKDPLGVPGALVKLLTSPFDGLRDDCGTAEDYYARRFATCYPLAASQKLTSPAAFDGLERSLNLQCRHYFAQCFNSQDNRYGKICDPMSNLYKQHAQDMEKGLREAAETYKHGLRNFLQSVKEVVICDPEFLTYGYYRDFVGQCGNALQRQIPLQFPRASNFPGNPKDKSAPNMAAPNCQPSPGGTVMFTAESVGETACRQAIPESSFVAMFNVVRHQTLCVSDSSGVKTPLQDMLPLRAVTTPSPSDLTRSGTRIPAEPVFPPDPNNLRTRPRALSILEQGRSAPNVNSGGPSAVQPNAPTPASAGVPGNNIPSGTAVACPLGAVYFNGSCNSGGADRVQRGGTSYDRNGRPITPPTPNPVPSGTAIARGCPPDSPVGVYPNCCPRYMTPDSAGGCSGSSRVQPNPLVLQRRDTATGNAIVRSAVPGSNAAKLPIGNTNVGPAVNQNLTTARPGIVPKEEPKKLRLRLAPVQPVKPRLESIVK